MLIISYYWPNLGGPGSLRPVKFAKYLPKFGIEPVILTRKNIAYHSLDNTLGNEARKIEVIRTESLDPARLLYLLGLRRYKPRSWHMPMKQAINFPDNKLPWTPFAYSSGTKIKFDCILVTAPPFSTFITGYYLAKKTDRPLILDFRDAWLEFPFMPYRGKVKKSFVLYWEEKITKYASLIIVVDENIKKSLSEKYPSLAKKIFVIPNGYDPDDFVITEKPKIFTVSYLGTIREERNPANILQALSKLASEKLISEHDLQLKFIGHVEDSYLKRIEKYSFVKCLGHLPYRDALKAFSASHLAILITTGNEFFFPSRQNEYLGSGLPIIVCGRSKGTHLLEEAFKKGYPGWIYDYDDITGIKNKIREIYRSYKEGKPVQGETPYKEYTRENLTKKLAEIIKKV